MVGGGGGGRGHFGGRRKVLDPFDNVARDPLSDAGVVRANDEAHNEGCEADSNADVTAVFSPASVLPSLSSSAAPGGTEEREREKWNGSKGRTHI